MQTTRSIDELREAIGGAGRCALVPTMGNLHDGHMALVRHAREAVASGAYASIDDFIRMALCRMDDDGRIEVDEQASDDFTEPRGGELSRLWHNAQDLQVVIDGEGVFLSVSPSATRLLGWTPEEMVGRSLFEFIRTDKKARYAEKHQNPLHCNSVSFGMFWQLASNLSTSYAMTQTAGLPPSWPSHALDCLGSSIWKKQTCAVGGEANGVVPGETIVSRFFSCIRC